MDIRNESEGDFDTISRIHREAFGDHGDVVVALLAPLRRLIETDGGHSLVAEIDGDLVGHVMFTPAWLDAPHQLTSVQVVSPLGVLPTHQRSGVGRALVNAGLQRAEEAKVPAVFLEGDPAYYQRLGFVAGGPLGFRKPSLRIPDAAFQVFPLNHYTPALTGTLVYPDVFWRHDAVGLRDE